MRWLDRRLRRIVDDERGANAVLIAFLIIPMLGFGALALDISAQHAERTQLQHGADSAALAVARACALDEPACEGRAQSDAGEFVEANGGTPVDGRADVEELNLTENEVRVAASAEFPHILESLITGDQETTVRARATAEWGYPDRGTTIPLAIADCEMSSHPTQPADTTNPQRFKLILANGNGSNPPCLSGPPGGFGWLAGADCEATIGIGGISQGETGIQSYRRSGCSDEDFANLLCKTVLLPLYDSVYEQGHRGEYRITRFAAFVLTGYQVQPSNRQYCGGTPLSPTFDNGEKGIQGYFVEYVSIDDADFELGDVDYGTDLMVVRLSD